MLKIRLARVGKKKQPNYRVVVAYARAARDGAFVEIIGHYNPLTNPKVVEINADKVRDWMAKGAQPTEPVQRLLAAQGVLPPLVKPNTPKKAVLAAAAAKEAAAATAAPPAAAAPPPAAVAPPAAEAPEEATAELEVSEPAAVAAPEAEATAEEAAEGSDDESEAKAEN